jgi:hypothetical protein
LLQNYLQNNAFYFCQDSGLFVLTDNPGSNDVFQRNRIKTPKRTRKQHNCVGYNVTYNKKTGVDWIGCSVCDGWFHVECTSLENDVYVEMAGSDVSIWLCKVCLPNLVKYIPVSSPVFALGDMRRV